MNSDEIQQEDILLKRIICLENQVDYLRRSCERKEELIIELRDEKIPYTNYYVKKLEKKIDYALEILSETMPPCKSNFMCVDAFSYETNCKRTKEQYKKCWDLFIEDKVREKGK